MVTWNIISLVILAGVGAAVFLDAQAIGNDGGRTPGIVDTKPGAWAAGVVLLLIVVLPIYGVMRFRYKAILAERKALQITQMQASTEETADVWPPPPRRPVP